MVVKLHPLQEFVINVLFVQILTFVKNVRIHAVMIILSLKSEKLSTHPSKSSQWSKMKKILWNSMDKDSQFQILRKGLIILEESLEAVQDNIVLEVLEDLDKVAKDLPRNGKSHLNNSTRMSNKQKRQKKVLRSLNLKWKPKLKNLKLKRKSLCLTLLTKNSFSMKQQLTYQTSWIKTSLKFIDSL